MESYIAPLRAKLEPFLGFLRSQQFGKPSLACDFQELYRYLIDDFIIGYCRDLSKRDFAYKKEMHSNKKAKRQYLKDDLANEFTNRLNDYFLSKVSIPRMKIGNEQEIETLINEEALLFAKFLREETKVGIPESLTFNFLRNTIDSNITIIKSGRIIKVGNSGTVRVGVGVAVGEEEMETEPSTKFIVCMLLQPLV